MREQAGMMTVTAQALPRRAGHSPLLGHRTQAGRSAQMARLPDKNKPGTHTAS